MENRTKENNENIWSVPELEIHPAEARHPDGTDGVIFETPDPDIIYH